MASELGAYLDPIADKALIVSIYITLAIVGVIPSWLVILVVSRDIMIVSAVILSWVMQQAGADRADDRQQAQHRGADRFRRAGAGQPGLSGSTPGRRCRSANCWSRC